MEPEHLPDTQLPDERLLVERAAAGDEGAFRTLVKAHEATVASIVTAMVGVGDDADDVGQETFVRLLRALPKFRGDSTVRTYVTRIAMNASLDLLARRRRRAKWLRLTGRADDEAAQLPDLRVDHALDAERREQMEALHRAVYSLDEKHRAVVVLRMLEEKSTRDTAELLGVPEGTVMSRLTRALAKLKTVLEPASHTS